MGYRKSGLKISVIFLGDHDNGRMGSISDSPRGWHRRIWSWEFLAEGANEGDGFGFEYGHGRVPEWVCVAELAPSIRP